MAIVANMTLIALALAMGVRLLNQYARRPRPHTLWYSLGLVLTAAAACPELYYEITGQVPTAMWWLYWSTASATVGYLGVGTAYLISSKWGKVALIGATTLTIWVILATMLTAGSEPAAGATALFSKAPTTAIKLPFLLQNILGSLVIFGGSVASYIRNRGLYNIWIALGTLVFASGGASAGLVNYSQLFYFTQTAGILLLSLGVSQSLQPPSSKKIPANHQG